MPASRSTTPMMQQYLSIKEEHRDAIVFFRLGDFYEMFFDDAEEASELLEITLTARHKGTPNEVPMCGVPAHSASGYIARLLEGGRKVAIAEQVGDPDTSKGPVERRVVRVVTPGTLVEDDLLRSRESNYLVAVVEDDDAVGLAALEVSTGDFVAAEFRGAGRRGRARDEVERFAPREVCHAEGAGPPEWLVAADTLAGRRSRWTWSPVAAWSFDAGRAGRGLREHLGVASLAGYDLDDRPLAVGAAGALLEYAAGAQKTPLAHVRAIRRLRERDFLELDGTTRRTLELVESWQERSREGSLLAVIDGTATSMGGRLLRQWLLRPLRDPAAVGERQELVQRLAGATMVRDRLREGLRRIRDLERLTTRVTLGSANPRDLAALRDSLDELPGLGEELAELEVTDLGRRLLDELDPCADVASLIAERLADEPPASVGDGGVIREGFDEELDRLRTARSEGKGFIASLQARERERTRIGSLKVGFNKVFGYYIEVSKANLARVPEDYTRKQTLTNAERYVTRELKEFEETVLNAEERIGALEARLFAGLRDAVGESAGRLHATARTVAAIDVLAGLAEVGEQRGWVRPRVDDGPVIEIRQGRHPIVEALGGEGRFVPNDAFLDDGARRIQILTGPNMGGKSTYLRQVALIVILAQMGAPVPAEEARIGVVDRVFTRVGASDNLARGASTFLVEMQETANILHNATPRSLVILDEVGRGTSTYDGLALAWAVVEYLQGHERVAARTLFATHYHELTALEGTLDSVRNLNVAAHEGPDGVVFLHQVEPGPADRSYGIHVGRLAGLPAELLERAGEILANLEASDAPQEGAPTWARPPDTPRQQLALFAPADHPVLEELARTDPDALTPLEALSLLARWKRELGERGD